MRGEKNLGNKTLKIKRGQKGIEGHAIFGV